MESSIGLAFLLTFVAGLSTCIGGLMGIFIRRNNSALLSFALGLSAGVMTYVSFMELMPEAVKLLSERFSEQQANCYMLMAFFAGIAMIAAIDRLIPSETNPHEIETRSEEKRRSGLRRTGVMVAVSLAIHNLPEGLATFAAAMYSIELALPIMVAIAIHNIPEGIAVAVPIYHATGSRKKAFWYATLSGMAEPVGALLGILFLQRIWSAELNALLLAGVSGVMIYISFDELLPNTERYGHHHYGVFGIVLGMAVMAISLLLL